MVQPLSGKAVHHVRASSIDNKSGNARKVTSALTKSKLTTKFHPESHVPSIAGSIEEIVVMDKKQDVTTVFQNDSEFKP